MELMGPLLLVLLLPQTLGFGYNNSTSKTNTSQSDVKSKAQKLKGSDLQSVFADISCHKCITCMERAITAHKINNNVIQLKNIEVMNYLNDEVQSKKRNAGGKKIKRNVSVAKYYVHGKLYALKVKDGTDNIKTDRAQKCYVYKIEHFYPCNTTKANLVLKAPQLQRKTKNKEEINSKKKLII